MKKLISLFLALAVLAGCMVTVASAAENTGLAVTEVTVCPGTENNKVVVDVKMVNNTAGIISGELKLFYDPQILKVHVETDEWGDKVVGVTFLDIFSTKAINIEEPGQIIVAFANETPVKGDRPLMTVTFDILDTEKVAKSDITLKTNAFYNSKGGVSFNPVVDNGFVSIAHIAEEDDGNCTTAIKCTACKTEITPAKADHTDVNPKDHKCDICGTEVSKCEGTFVAGKNATCTEDGWKDYYGCSCGKFYADKDCTKEIKDLEAWKKGEGKIGTLTHKYEVEVAGTRKDATCMATGSVTMKCKTCEATDVVTLQKDPAKHTGNNTVVGAKAATCGADGHTGKTVCECGVTIDEGKGIPATGNHTGGTATCKDKAVCSVCSKAYGDKNSSNHAGGTTIKNAKEETCGEAGYTGDTYCVGCNTVIEAGETIPATGNHTGGTATCMDKAVCSVCSKAYGDKNSSNHAGGTTIKNAKEATCGEAGYTGDTYCVGCSTKIKDGEAISATGKHADVTTDKDHKCDVCGAENITEHKSQANSHYCDCGEKMSEHEADGHNCKICGEKLTDHKDENGDNVCDICGGSLACNHKDSNNDHKCDTCKETISECADTNNDHKCDTCKNTISKCADTNNDHKCDTCGKELSKCADKNKDHKCDTCGKVLSECADKNKDHKCDTCGKVLSECVDANKDHKCDTCGKVLSECADANKDGKCDICGAVVETEEKVSRIAGASRADTALEVAKTLKETLGVEKFDTIIIANGEDKNFADALTGSYLATAKKAPILLYRTSGLSEATNAYIRENLKAGGTVYLLGGELAIPATVAESLSASYTVKRLAGTSRFDTNLAILKEAGVTNEEILIARGYEFADSLSASATGLPILLVNEVTGKLTDAQVEFLQQRKNNKMTILGGELAVSEELEATIEEVVGHNVDRVFGTRREDTSVEIAKRYFPEADFAVVAYSRKCPDGLCGGPLAYAKKAPLLLTNTGAEDAANGYVTANGIDSGYVLGGTLVVSDETAREVFGLSENTVISAK